MMIMVCLQEIDENSLFVRHYEDNSLCVRHNDENGLFVRHYYGIDLVMISMVYL
jgi:hypothetical protein